MDEPAVNPGEKPKINYVTEQELYNIKNIIDSNTTNVTNLQDDFHKLTCEVDELHKKDSDSIAEVMAISENTAFDTAQATRNINKITKQIRALAVISSIGLASAVASLILSLVNFL